MPSGRVHLAANVVAGAAMTLLALPDIALPVLVGSVIGTFVTPDLDVDHTTESEALLRKIPVVGYVFQIAWYPYALLHGHRGVSHWPVIGTLGRVAYLALLAGLIGVFAAGWGANLDRIVDAVRQIPLDRLAWLLLAWLAQDLVHIALDALG